MKSEEYRQQLASELRTLRGTGERGEAKALLAEEQEKHIYKISKMLQHFEESNGKFDDREYSEEVEYDQRERFFVVSNEPSLYETFEFIRDRKGAGIGVGFDQMFDITVNSNLNEAYIVDITHSVSLSTRALLEVGRRHHDLFGTYPTPDQFLNYFQESNIDTTLEMVESEFDEGEVAILLKALTQKLKKEKGSNEDIPGEPMIYRTLRYKADQSNYSSWLSNPENLKKIIDMYESGKIKVVMGDLQGDKSIQAIGQHLQEEGTSLSVVYLSNAPAYFGSYAGFMKNLDSLPIEGDTLLIQTSSVGRFDGAAVQKPVDIQADPYLDKLSLEWTYILQTAEDTYQTTSGGYKITEDGDTYSLGLFDRVHLSDEGKPGMNIKKPKQGVILAGL